ncbi:hypothetical protein M427DRAFT_67532 [Gonapodya prolifera JEL478]|uniref:Reelin domain-containing protein n=1 Tax=Gonapodya prolifera (strain JEL478) TaxID=1344416 RepID=A0A139AQC9_GONPJ|nr:hypothetical protein M427DRAFT_67532 [Gonapodya prolifera JEL478]|eukprot:KXS18949.1 hypothetical protein M427DRAFT_67532 [Gonapodya prolifera JEL478]
MRLSLLTPGTDQRHIRAFLAIVAFSALIVAQTLANPTTSGGLCSDDVSTLAMSAHGSSTFSGTCPVISVAAQSSQLKYSVTLSAAIPQFEGLLLYVANGAGSGIGTFTLPGNAYRFPTTCSSSGPFIEHTYKNFKSLPVTFTWTAPSNIANGSAAFVRGVVVYNSISNWCQLTSRSFTVINAQATQSPAPSATRTTTTVPMSKGIQPTGTSTASSPSPSVNTTNAGNPEGDTDGSSSSSLSTQTVVRRTRVYIAMASSCTAVSLTLSAIHAVLKKRDAARSKKETRDSPEKGPAVPSKQNTTAPRAGSSTALDHASQSTPVPRRALPSALRTTVVVAVSIAGTLSTTVLAYSTGAGSICTDSTTQLASAHGPSNWGSGMCHGITVTQGSTYRSWTIQLNPSTPGATVEGLLLYTENSAAAKVGTFTSTTGMRLKTDCSGVTAGPMLEHTSKVAKALPASFSWTAPSSVPDGATITVKGLVVGTSMRNFCQVRGAMYSLVPPPSTASRAGNATETAVGGQTQPTATGTAGQGWGTGGGGTGGTNGTGTSDGSTDGGDSALSATTPTIFETTDTVWLVCIMGAVLACTAYIAEEYLRHVELVRVRRGETQGSKDARGKRVGNQQ